MGTMYLQFWPGGQHRTESWSEVSQMQTVDVGQQNSLLPWQKARPATDEQVASWAEVKLIRPILKAKSTEESIMAMLMMMFDGAGTVGIHGRKRSLYLLQSYLEAQWLGSWFGGIQCEPCNATFQIIRVL